MSNEDTDWDIYLDDERPDPHRSYSSGNPSDEVRRFMSRFQDQVASQEVTFGRRADWEEHMKEKHGKDWGDRKRRPVDTFPTGYAEQD